MPNEHAPKHLLCLESCLEFVMASTHTIDQEALRKSHHIWSPAGH
jgi:hypothetical protein